MTKTILTRKDLSQRLLYNAKGDCIYRLARIGVFTLPAIVLAILAPWYVAVGIGAVFAALIIWSLLAYQQTKRIVENGEIAVLQEPLTEIRKRKNAHYATLSRPEIDFIFREAHHKVRGVDHVLAEMSAVGDLFYLVFADRKHKKIALYYNMNHYEIV